MGSNTPPNIFYGLDFQEQISLGICRRVQVLMVFMENGPRNVTITCVSFLYPPATRTRERFNLLLRSQKQSPVMRCF